MVATVLRPETEILALARTIYGEARGESVRGQIAVAIVVMNRLRSGRWGGTIHDVVTARLQFSAWNPRDPNREKLMDPEEVDGWNTAVWVARLVGQLVKPAEELEPALKGALHYHAKGITPRWAKGHGACYQTGNHVFYNTVV